MMPAPIVPAYPIRFKEIYKDKIWGGAELKKQFGKKGAGSKVGESWEIAHRDDSMSVAVNGPFKGWSLDRLIQKHRREILGEEHSMRFRRFPILVKFLAVHERLSLQVHPSDEYAQRYEREGVGKMEAWYVLSAPKTARVIRGVLPGTTVAEFKQHLRDGKVEECLNIMEVDEGDVIFVPPGTIHSAFGGLVVLEVQQNSDVTYRLTDWGRGDARGRSRPLDVEKAMNVTDFYSMGVSKYKPSRITGYSYRRKLLIKCEKFTMESIQLGKQRITERFPAARSVVHTIVRGAGRYNFDPELKSSQAFRKGETYLIPANMGDFEIVSQAETEIVVSYVE